MKIRRPYPNEIIHSDENFRQRRALDRALYSNRPTIHWSERAEKRGKGYTKTIPTNNALLQNPEVVGIVSNYIDKPYEIPQALLQLSEVYPLTEQGDYNGWTPQRFADIVDQYKKMLRINETYTSAKRRGEEARDQAYTKAWKNQIGVAGSQTIGRRQKKR